MVENLSRKLFILGGLLVLSVASLWFLGFRLGLDLQGGTRLVYSVDIDAAVERGEITAEELQQKGRAGLLDEVKKIWLARIDPKGVAGVSVRSEGQDHLVIELPGSASSSAKNVSAPLAIDISPDDIRVDLPDDPAVYNDFPAAGGRVEIGGEVLRYGKRIDNLLLDVDRAVEGKRAQHLAGTEVRLKASDPFINLIENTGDLQFRIKAKDTDLASTNPAQRTDLASELERVKAWVQARPDSPIRAYNDELQARQSRLRFYPRVLNEEETQAGNAALVDRLEAVIIEENERWRFTGGDIDAVYPSNDDLGFPAVGFKMKFDKRGDFGDFTEEHIDENMAIVINDEIVTFPVIQDKLPGQGIINGGGAGFTPKEMNDLISTLRSGSLKLTPEFEAQETVGATLGAEYVQRGVFSALIGIVLVLAFVLVYYRRLGVFAAASLLFNLVILMGAMAFIRATLTLPGVAGIILTVGMAIDANILIYERIREEALRGRKPLQAAKDGFGNALSTIVDANLTTLLTGLILYKFGTGPVRGFATTLCIGIITSMISALICTRVLVHFQLERGIERWSMMRLISETNIRFIRKSKVALMISGVLIVAGLGAFLSLDEDERLGIDFLGGTSMVVRTEQPEDVETIRGLLRDEAGSSKFAANAEVTAILNSAGDGGYTSFRIVSKSVESDQGTIRADVETWLGEILAKGPVDDSAVEAGQATARLYFEQEHSTADLVAALDHIGITDATASLADPDNPRIVTIAGKVPLDYDAKRLGLLINSELVLQHDSVDDRFLLASPVSELSSVGAQVVADLRDKAIFAILLSLFAAVMYIRVRFAEYSYGFAAVVALVHDVLIALGAISVAIMTGLVAAEINLAMIAAFLTIIGYSLNDTIVVFDRIRENLPRSKGTLEEVIDTSINQTLSRTVLTSTTTLISVALLFAFNVGTGNVIEGFAFALMVGIIVGTYSTMFVASIVLLKLEAPRQRRLAEQGGAAEKKALAETV
jgi:protein-export membrane protein SecD/preprotein translocase SecF subunit